MAYLGTAVPKSPLGDPIIYSNLGKAFAAGESWPLEVVFRSPLYPYVVGWFYKLFGDSPITVILFQNLVGLIAGMLLLEILLRTGGKRRAFFWIGLVLLLQSGVWAVYEWKLFPVSLATTVQVFLVATVWLFSTEQGLSVARKHLYLGLVGVFAGLLVLLRPNYLLFLPMLIVFAVLPSTRKRVGWAPLIYWVVLPALMLTPIMKRNHSMGAGFGLTANSGITFFHGNNPNARGGYAAVPGVSPDVLMQNKDVLHVARQNGAKTISAANQFWMNQGKRFLKENPGAAVKLIFFKFVGFISPWEAGGDLPFKFEKLQVPFLRFVSLGNFSLLLFFSFFGIKTLWRQQREVTFAVAALFTVTLATSLIFYMNNRYRIPAWSMLFLPASLGLGLLVDDLKQLWSKGSEFFKLSILAKVAVGVAVIALTIPIKLSIYELAAGWHNWAVMNSKIGKVDEAVSSYLRVLKIDPNHRPSLSNLSRVELTQGNLDKSEFLSKRLTKRYPDSYVGWTNLSDIFIKRRNFDAAVGYAKTALRVRPQSQRAQISLAKAAFLAEDYKTACPLLDKLVAANVRDTLVVGFKRSCKSVLARQAN